MKKTLYIRIDSSPLPEGAEDAICLDCNLENYFCTFLGRTLLKAIDTDESVKYPGELFTDFAKFNVEDYRSIIEQWEKAIPYLVNKMHDEGYNLTIQLPSAYRNWLCQHERVCFQEIGRKLDTDLLIQCDTECLYNEVIVNFLLRKLIFFLKKNIEEIECVTLPFPLYHGSCLDDILIDNEEFHRLYIRNCWGIYTFDSLYMYSAEYDFCDGFALCNINDEYYSYIDDNGRFWLDADIPKPILDAHDFSEGLAAIKQEDKWGFIDWNGELVIPCIYEEVGDFSEGLACVKLNDKWGFINKQGIERIACRFDYVSKYKCSSPLRLFVREGDERFFIDGNGDIKIKCAKYDFYLESFKEGMLIVGKNNKFGSIDLWGNEAIPCIYDMLGSFSEGLAGIMQMNKWGCIDKKGRMIIPCIYEEISIFIEGRAAVARQNKWGYIDKQGVEIIPCIYEDCWDYSEGLACVQKGNKWGYVDKFNKEVIPFIYNNAFPFSEGMARVQLHENEEYDYINKNWFIK